MCKNGFPVVFQSLPTGRFAKPCRVLSPCLRADEPHGRALIHRKGKCQAVRKTKNMLFLNV